MRNLLSTTAGVASDRVGRMALMTYTCLEGKKCSGGISLQLLYCTPHFCVLLCVGLCNTSV